MFTRKFFSCFIVTMLWSALGFSQIDRPYEPMVITGDTLKGFVNQEIGHLYLYAYHASDSSWRMIPFQIDEVNPKVNDSLKYFIPEDSLGGLLDGNDEVVLILGDLGDRADTTTWLTGADSLRYEIAVVDPLSGRMGYVYLFASNAISEPIPDQYGMRYDSVNDRVITANYELGFNKTGQTSDVIIRAAIGGSGRDIFDRLKIRGLGSFLFLPVILYEDQISKNYAYAKTGPVRIIRNMYGQFFYELIGGVKFDEDFTQTSFFYPWNSTFQLVEIPINDAADYGVSVDVFRVSWDFNRHATGMKFYTETNRNGLLIDGQGKRDNIDPTCFPGQLNWTMGTGDQGTLLNVFYVPPLGDVIRIYYYDHFSTDSKEKTDDNFGYKFDTGDDSSFADNGFSLEKHVEKYAAAESTFDVIYYNFFLPPNFSPDAASLMCEQLKSPVKYYTRLQRYVPPKPLRVADAFYPLPEELVLFQNYPNPFNAATTISFEVTEQAPVSLQIFDPLGRKVATLVDQALRPGRHRVVWEGQDQQHQALPSGVYFCRLTINGRQLIKKLVLIR